MVRPYIFVTMAFDFWAGDLTFSTYEYLTCWSSVLSNELKPLKNILIVLFSFPPAPSVVADKHFMAWK